MSSRPHDRRHSRRRPSNQERSGSGFRSFLGDLAKEFFEGVLTATDDHRERRGRDRAHGRRHHSHERRDDTSSANHLSNNPREGVLADPTYVNTEYNARIGRGSQYTYDGPMSSEDRTPSRESLHERSQPSEPYQEEGQDSTWTPYQDSYQRRYSDSHHTGSQEGDQPQFGRTSLDPNQFRVESSLTHETRGNTKRMCQWNNTHERGRETYSEAVSLDQWGKVYGRTPVCTAVSRVLLFSNATANETVL